MTHDSDVFNIHEAATFLGAHEQTIRKLARRGAIPAFKVGKDWRFRRENLIRWSEDQQRNSGRCSVLIIDDDELVCRTLSRMLVNIGCRVMAATGGREGLLQVRDSAPGLILLDLKMPDISGSQFLRELRKTHAALPVVIITGYPESEFMQESLQYAPLMVLPKPVDQKLLERTVRVVFGQKAEPAGL
jgi:excisionase family DNA binding protein